MAVTYLQSQECAAMTTVSSRELNQGVPVANAEVRLLLAPTDALADSKRNIADALAMPGVADIEFEPPRMSLDLKPADFD
jgi:hypothetical protein